MLMNVLIIATVKCRYLHTPTHNHEAPKHNMRPRYILVELAI